MFEGLLHLFARRSIALVLTDVADILLVTFVIYRALLVLRGTRAMQMVFGLAVIGLVYGVSKWADLTTLFSLLNALLSSIPLVIVVVFQNDIRRGLMRVGARAFLGGLARQQESRVIDEVVSAATELARHRIGALIAFEQDANLDEFVVGQGTTVDASVQRELLVSLFLPESLNKLHDGAVVIRNLRIAKAGVFFPMPDTKILDKSLGSRHRAAVGITEETDAVVVVVSEERGTISFCFNGNVVTNLDGASLRQALLGLFGQTAAAGSSVGPAGTRKRPKTSKRGGTVTQTGTGSFRVVPPSGAPSELRSSRPPEPPSMATAEGTGSLLLPPPAPRGDAPRSERPEKSEPSRHAVRPMAPARPIETPKPVAAPDLPPPGSRED
jgi:diadenylate cyclase